MEDLPHKGKTCGDCAWLTEKFPVKNDTYALCRLIVLGESLAMMQKDEIACPEFVSR